MSKRAVKASAIVAVLLILGFAGVIWHNYDAFAKSQPQKKSAVELMSIYSVKTKQSTKTHVQRSRLPQMNIVSEAANVLNVLPITIMDEMNKGKNLEQIAKDKGLSKDEFLKRLTAYENKTVAAAAKDGTITRKHKTALKEGQKDRLTKSLTLKATDVNDHMTMDMGN